uniref:DNA helicase n=1 Tax=uncultured Clostridium sp. TaxID=59620 RepID=UPI00260EA1BC
RVVNFLMIFWITISLCYTTGQAMKGYINNIKKLETTDYKVPITYDFIKTLSIFKKDRTIADLLEESREGAEKAIVFIDSAKKAYELYEKFKDIAMFNCSKNNADYYKYVDEAKIQKMLEKERFEEKILITTCCMDAGVNIIDDNVKHILADVKDFGTLIQCIGRKRRKKDEQIYLYIKNISNQQFGGMKGRCVKLLKEADYLLKNGIDAYLDEYDRANTSLIYDKKAEIKYDKKINEMMYYKLTLDAAEYDYVVNIDKNYTKYLIRKFDFKGRVRVLEESEGTELEQYLDGLVGSVMLQVKDRKELIEKLDVRQDSKLLKKINSLNSALEERKLMYRIEEFKTSRIIDGKKKNFKSAWKIMKLIG